MSRERVCFRIERRVRAALERVAILNGRSLSQEIEVRLAESVGLGDDQRGQLSGGDADQAAV